MRFEWDEPKNRRNVAKHGTPFEVAALVFDDPHALSFQDRIVNDELRWQTFETVSGLVLMVAHTWFEDEGEDVIRIISARRAASFERSVYEAHKRSG
jgi:uncharacterized DUF497 family protein